MEVKALGTKGEKVRIRKILPTNSKKELVEIEFENVYGHWQSVSINSEIFNTMITRLDVHLPICPSCGSTEWECWGCALGLREALMEVRNARKNNQLDSG